MDGGNVLHLQHPWRPRAALVTLASALTAIVAGPAHAGDGFRPLSIDGSAVRWQRNSPHETTTLRYAIASNAVQRSGAVNCGSTRAPDGILARSQLDRAAFKEAATEAFARWQRIARIRFFEVADQDSADIVIGEQAVPTGHAFTNLALGGAPRDALRPIVHATICLNPERRWKIGFDGNLTSYDLVHTLTHEIGHAIGLDHPGARGHVMSFRYDEAHAGLTAGDVLGARTIYGAADPQAASEGRRPAVARSAPESARQAVGRGMSD